MQKHCSFRSLIVLCQGDISSNSEAGLHRYDEENLHNSATWVILVFFSNTPASTSQKFLISLCTFGFRVPLRQGARFSRSLQKQTPRRTRQLGRSQDHNIKNKQKWVNASITHQYCMMHSDTAHASFFVTFSSSNSREQSLEKAAKQCEVFPRHPRGSPLDRRAVQFPPIDQQPPTPQITQSTQSVNF